MVFAGHLPQHWRHGRGLLRGSLPRLQRPDTVSKPTLAPGVGCSVLSPSSTDMYIYIYITNYSYRKP